MTKASKSKNRVLVILGIGSFLIIGSFAYFNSRMPSQDKFEAPGKSWNSPKKVENYFIERLHMTPQEASEIRSKPGVDGTVDLRINTNVTLEALVSNLSYYGFVKDEKAFLYALEHTKDITTGQTFIKVGETRTIDTNAENRISENMSAWQIADILLNRPSGHFSFDEYNYFFMP